MGSRELKQAFNEITSPTATASVALLEYDRKDGDEWQNLFFSGSYADGVGFAIKSDRIRASADVNEAARETGRRLLQQRATA